MNLVNNYLIKNKIFILFIFLFIIYAVIVFNNLLTEPYVWLDEGFKMQLARNFAEFGQIGIQFIPGQIDYSVHNVSTGWVVPFELGLLFKLFGTNFLIARLFSSFYLLSFVFLCFLLARQFWGKGYAL